jgi:hypothetical protein
MTAASETQHETGLIIVIGNFYWGAGRDLATAKRNFRKEGGRLGRGYMIITFNDVTEFHGVDQMGRVHWVGDEPETRTVSPRKGVS